jgi:hypothetical protein
MLRRHLQHGRIYLDASIPDHDLFFMQRVQPLVKKIFCHHTGSQVADFETQLIGRDWLSGKGWNCVWGVGRHVTGSHIFEY